MHVRVTRPPPTHTHTHRHTQIQIHRHRHTQTQTHSHTDTETQTHSHTHTLTHRAARKHGCSFRNRTNLLARGLLDPEFVLHGNHVSLLRPVCALLSQDVGKRVQKRNLLGGGRVREEANPEQQEQQKQQHHQQRSSTAQETCGFLTKRHNTNHALVPSPPLSCPSIAPQMSALPFHAFSFALCSDKTHHLNARRMRGASAWPASSAFSVTALASDLKEAQKKKGVQHKAGVHHILLPFLHHHAVGSLSTRTRTCTHARSHMLPPVWPRSTYSSSLEQPSILAITSFHAMSADPGCRYSCQRQTKVGWAYAGASVSARQAKQGKEGKEGK